MAFAIRIFATIRIFAAIRDPVTRFLIFILLPAMVGFAVGLLVARRELDRGLYQLRIARQLYRQGEQKEFVRVALKTAGIFSGVFLLLFWMVARVSPVFQLASPQYGKFSVNVFIAGFLVAIATYGIQYLRLEKSVDTRVALNPLDLARAGIRSDDDLAIRAATPADAPMLCGWWNDGAVMAHAGFPDGLGTTPEVIAASLETDSNETHRRMILEFDGLPIGEANYRVVGPGVAEIGIKICHPDMQDAGLGTRFLTMLVDGLFRDSGMRKIVLDTNLLNARAQHVYEKLGFRRVGVRTDSWKNQLGELQSSVDYELTAEEWAAR